MQKVSKILLKWLIGIYKHPINIIKGNLYRFLDKNDNLYHSRYQKCIFCKERDHTPIGYICGLCGCPLESKLRVKDEKCELDKWEK